MMIAPIAALIFATLFAGAALYITLVEHPARLLLDDSAALAQWQPSYDRALPLQAGLAILGGIAGFVAWWASHDLIWLAGSLILLANWPFTLLVIMPVNKRLHAIRPRDADTGSRRLLVRWGALHRVRSGLGTLALLLFATALAGAA